MNLFTSQKPSNSSDGVAWKTWNPEIAKFYHSQVAFDDKILLIGNLKEKSEHHDTAQPETVVLVDLKTKKCQTLVIEGLGLGHHLGENISCHWKDSTIVVIVGFEGVKAVFQLIICTITIEKPNEEGTRAVFNQLSSNTLFRKGPNSSYIYKDHLYVFHGDGTDPQKETDINIMNLKTRSWLITSLKPETTDYGTHGALVSQGQKLYVLNSFNKTLEISEYNLETMEVKKFTRPGRPDCKSFSACREVIDGKIYIIGAFPDPKTGFKNEIWVYDLNTKELTEIKTTGVDSISFRDLGYFICSNKELVVLRAWQKPEGHGFELQSLDLNSKAVDGKSENVIERGPENYSYSPQQIMKKLLKEAPYSDISFEVEAEVVPAHKWWLCKKSKYFANMFASGMMEAQASKIKIYDMTATTFKAFLEFLYSEDIQLDDKMAVELLQQADKYSVPDLKKACETYLVENLKPENYVLVGQMAELLDIVLLREAVVGFIAKNVKTLKQRKDFEEISDSLLRDSIVKFIVK